MAATRAIRFALSSDEAPDTVKEFALTIAPPFHLGLGSLACILFTSTFVHPGKGTPTLPAKLLRVLLAIPALYGFYSFGFGHYTSYDPRFSPGIYCSLSPVALYAMMFVIDASFITFITNDTPRWVSLTSNEVLPLPTTFAGRTAYALDLLSSMRGISWYSDRRWDFTSSVVANQQARLSTTSRAQFVRYNCFNFTVYFLLIDIIDTYIKNLQPNMSLVKPVSEGLPAHHQLLCAIAICVWTYLAIVYEQTIMAIVFVGLGVSEPKSWVPMFDGNPLLAKSLPEFWGRKWHYIFRRLFDRMLIPFIPRQAKSSETKANGNGSAHSTKKPASNRTAILPRLAGTFILSTLLHLIIMHRSVPRPDAPYSRFIDFGVLSFFLAQPVGIVLDTLLLRVVGEKSVARRVFAWAWLLWSARWWADVWVRKSQWEVHERFIPLSPLRGVLWGDWEGLGHLST